MEVLVLFGWLFVIYIILLGGTLAICSFLAWKDEKRRQIERNLRIKKEFHDTAALCYDVLQFKERGGAGKYFVLYEEGKQYSIHRPFIILDTIHDDRGQKAFEKMYQKTWKSLAGLPYKITCHRTPEEYKEEVCGELILQEDTSDESAIEYFRNLSNPKDYAIFGLSDDCGPTEGNKSFWYILGKRGTIVDENKPAWIVISGNGVFPLTKEEGESRLKRMFSKAQVSIIILYPKYTIDDICELKMGKVTYL